MIQDSTIVAIEGENHTKLSNITSFNDLEWVDFKVTELDALNILCVQLMHDLSAIANFLVKTGHISIICSHILT